MPSRDELHARLFLLRAAEPPAPAIHQYVAVHGPVDALARIRHGTAPAAVLSEVTRPEAQIDDDLRALDNGSARLLTPEDGDWPLGRLTGLASLGVPLALWVRGSGSLAELTSLAVTVTGARASSAYGNTIAADLGYELGRAGVTVVSGGGLGVDEEAHRSALAADGRTIVVLANGVDLTHPHQHARLYQTVIEQGGLLVSEYPIGTPSARIRFHARCRLLAALAAATVIVEAGQRSGALGVARAAGELGRRVYGVPGSIHSVTSKGVNELLRTGAATAASSVEHINYQEGVR
ncbi:MULTISPECIES: DNA-processing protein DprA [Actinomycetes]|uniref:DNA-processing protein DprA n=1 Tax=Amycolatopsis acididurans TaxID=2724524 RepID=A0ABX1JHN7_9PSEU|nr:MULTISPECIES: DNA-processing protein DprA [Actinomycetes]NKQ59253.1 DNA-processing protein DprA [Amycolatopsis acididurans]HWC23604.1 DNA-processing protein DprA [Flexivirga sp.]